MLYSIWSRVPYGPACPSNKTPVSLARDAWIRFHFFIIFHQTLHLLTFFSFSHHLLIVVIGSAGPRDRATGKRELGGYLGMVLEKSGLDTIFHVGALSGEKRGSKLGRKGGRESKSRLGEGAHRVYFGHVRPIGRPFRRPRIFDPGDGPSYFRAVKTFFRADLPGGVAEGGVYERVSRVEGSDGS